MVDCKKGECQDCGYWPNEGKRTTSCHRFPQSAATGPTYWCGEFVPRNETDQKVVTNKLESKKTREAKLAAADAARTAPPEPVST